MGVRVHPLTMADDGQYGSFDLIYEKIKDIDPRIFVPDRTVEWLRGAIKRFESMCNRINTNFTASGNYQGDNLYSMWYNYCNGEAAWVYFIPLCLHITEMNVFNKVMAEGMGRDTGILGVAIELKKKQQGAARSRKYRYLNKDEKKNVILKEKSEKISCTDDSKFLQNIAESYEKDNKVKSLDLIMKYGSEEDKVRALKEIKQLQWGEKDEIAVPAVRAVPEEVENNFYDISEIQDDETNYYEEDVFEENQFEESAPYTATTDSDSDGESFVSAEAASFQEINNNTERSFTSIALPLLLSLAARSHWLLKFPLRFQLK